LRSGVTSRGRTASQPKTERESEGCDMKKF